MLRFQFELLVHLLGIGSASGLICHDKVLYMISDNAGFVYQYNLETNGLDKNPIITDSVLEKIPKAKKPDFEAMAEYQGHFYIFGSGSKAKRNRMVKVDITTKKIVAEIDLTGLYTAMQHEAKMTGKDFNIEGALNADKCWYFLQRGNGRNGRNGIFTISGDLEKNPEIKFTSIQLPEINGIRATFTDGCAVGDKLYFLAAAENSDSTYADGQVMGTMLGIIDLKTLKLEETAELTLSHKLEGLALGKESKDTLTFYACEDADTDALEAGVFKITLNKEQVKIKKAKPDHH